MKKIKSYGLSLAVISVVGLGFSGCGSSSNDNSASTTNVTVERGAVYDANVTDADGHIAIQQNNSNIYTFSTPPTYPITATNGWIDVDGDGNMTAGVDVELDLNLTSYSNVITPITTYIADSNETVRHQRILQLSQDMNCSESDLLKAPSETNSTNVLLAVNAIYKTMKEYNSTKIHNVYFDLNSSFHTLKTTYDQSGSQHETGDTDEDKHKNLAIWLEKDIVMSDLNSRGEITHLDDTKIKYYEEKHSGSDD